ncbi:MAG: AAA family ATPase [Oscillospiraceae bacterium]
MNFNELSVSGLYINKLQMVNNFLSGLSYGKILSGECGNGKSTVMSMIDMLYSQEKCNLSEWSELKKQVNDKIPVIKVSFSDFKPGTYEDIIAQTAGMLKNLYLQYTDYILTEEYDNYRYKEYFLDVIEGKCDDLESGLERLIRMICDAGIEKNERPVLLVDEPYEPIHICEKQDYDKTKEFFKRFFHFTECQAASKMIFFNSYPINSYYAPYIRLFCERYLFQGNSSVIFSE